MIPLSIRVTIGKNEYLLWYDCVRVVCLARKINAGFQVFPMLRNHYVRLQFLRSGCRDKHRLVRKIIFTDVPHKLCIGPDGVISLRLLLINVEIATETSFVIGSYLDTFYQAPRRGCQFYINVTACIGLHHCQRIHYMHSEPHPFSSQIHTAIGMYTHLLLREVGQFLFEKTNNRIRHYWPGTYIRHKHKYQK